MGVESLLCKFLLLDKFSTVLRKPALQKFMHAMTGRSELNAMPSASKHALILVCTTGHQENCRANGDSDLQLDVHTVKCICRTALQAYVIDVIHSLVEEQISPVLVRLATTGPQVRT